MLSPVKPQTLASLARVLRSKNAGPTLLTIDIFFQDAAGYAQAAASPALSVPAVAALYQADPAQVQRHLLPTLLAIKYALPRRSVRRHAWRWRCVWRAAARPHAGHPAGRRAMSASERLLQSHRLQDGPLRILAASGQLGYGIPEAALQRGLARRPHLIGCDMGSIDPGPYYLGSGQMAAPAAMVYRDLELVLTAALAQGIPLIIGSAGTAGARPQLEATVALVRAIAQAKGLRFRLTTVASDLAPELVLQALRAGQLQPIGPMANPTEADILQCSHIVGQCGTETLARALREPTDVLIAGRACDTAVFAALPEMLGYPTALCQHMAKIIECTSLCCNPSARDAMLAELDQDGFTLESMNPLAHATPASVAAHALYEQANPFEVDEPTGTLLLQQAQYQALDAHRTRVSGAQWRPRPQATLKIEGAARVR